MRKFTFLIFAFIISVSSLNAQHKLKNLFRGYLNDEGIMSYSFDGNVTQYLKSSDGTEVKSTIDNVNLIYFKEGGDISSRDLEKINKAIEKDNYEVLVKTKVDGLTSKLYGISNGDTISQLYARVKLKEKGTAYLLFKGKIFFDELSKFDLSKINGNFDF